MPLPANWDRLPSLLSGPASSTARRLPATVSHISRVLFRSTTAMIRPSGDQHIWLGQPVVLSGGRHSLPVTVSQKCHGIADSPLAACGGVKATTLPSGDRLTYCSWNRFLTSTSVMSRGVRAVSLRSAMFHLTTACTLVSPVSSLLSLENARKSQLA